MRNLHSIEANVRRGQISVYLAVNILTEGVFNDLAVVFYGNRVVALMLISV